MSMRPQSNAAFNPFAGGAAAAAVGLGSGGGLSGMSVQPQQQKPKDAFDSLGW